MSPSNTWSHGTLAMKCCMMVLVSKLLHNDTKILMLAKCKHSQGRDSLLKSDCRFAIFYMCMTFMNTIEKKILTIQKIKCNVFIPNN